jgi:hypothetical protein
MATRSCTGTEDSENLLTVIPVDEGRRRGRRRRRRRITLENILSNIALAEVDVPVGVADAVVPNYWVRDVVPGLNRRVPWAPVTWSLWVVVGTAGPRTERHGTALGLGGTRGQAETAHSQTTYRQRSRR